MKTIRKDINKIGNHFNGIMSMRTLVVFLFIVSAFIFVWSVICKRWDTDSLWMIAQGREILENGISYTDMFRILPDMNVTVQGWLFYVIVALFDNLGVIGGILFQVLNVSVSFIAGYLYLSQYKIKFEYKMFAVLCLMFIIGYPSTPRPEGITAVLLIFECIAFERYKHTKKWQWLLILPAGMLLEVNLHASMIWFHFLIALAYIVPSVIRKAYLTYNKSWKMPMLFTALMIPCMFVNPYGIEGVLYLPKSFLANTFNYVTIKEMSPDFNTIILIAVIIIGIYFLTYWKKKRQLYSYQVYLVLGFFILQFMALRNVIFMYPAILTILAPFLVHITNTEIKPRRYFIYLMIFICLFFGLNIGMEVKEVCLDIKETPSEIAMRNNGYDESILDADIYMENNDDITELKLFAGLDTGAYFEYLGYTNVYMEARPENRMKTMNGQRDELIEYSKYCVKEFDEDANIDEIYSEISNWLEDYDFDYIYIKKTVEKSLYKYLSETDNDYELLIDTEKGAFYEKE